MAPARSAGLGLCGSSKDSGFVRGHRGAGSHHQHQRVIFDLVLTLGGAGRRRSFGRHRVPDVKRLSSDGGRQHPPLLDVLRARRMPHDLHLGTRPGKYKASIRCHATHHGTSWLRRRCRTPPLFQEASAYQVGHRRSSGIHATVSSLRGDGQEDTETHRAHRRPQRARSVRRYPLGTRPTITMSTRPTHRSTERLSAARESKDVATLYSNRLKESISSSTALNKGLGNRQRGRPSGSTSTTPHGGTTWP